MPEDLLLTFGDVAKKYNLGVFVNFAAAFPQGVGDIISLPTIYVLKVLDFSILQDLQTGFLTNARHNNHELYAKALAELGLDALLNSSVVAIDRNSSGQYAKVLVQTPAGTNLFLAKKFFITNAPLLKTLNHFNLNNEERSLFAKFKHVSDYTAVLRNNVFPANLSLQGIDPRRLYNIPNLSIGYSFSPTAIPVLQNVKYISIKSLPLEQAKVDVINIAKLSTANNLALEM